MKRIAIALFFFSIAASAQQADTGVGIASFTGGGLFGVGAHGSVGGNIAAPVTRNLMPYFEFAYSPLTSYGYTYGVENAGKGLFRSGLVDANGGIKIRFPGKSDWVPFVGFGAGVLRVSSTDYTSGFGSTATVKSSHSDFAGNASAGALYYFTAHFGFEVELKGYAAEHERLGRATAGVFYQFP